MERHLDEELEIFNKDLLSMAALTEMAIHKSIEALKARNKNLAKTVIDEDKVIDDYENKLEELGVRILALYQPMARDLRFVTTGMQITMELERIADLTVNICQRVLDIADQPILKPLTRIPQLAENAKKMVKSSIDAFVNRDEELAKEIILSDRESNQLRNAIVQELIYEYMAKDGSTAPRAVPLLLVARDLERICDHATSIAEDVIYMINAKMVKHHLEEIIPPNKEK